MRSLIILLILSVSVSCYGMNVARSVSFKDQQLQTSSQTLGGQPTITGGQSAELNMLFDQIILAISGRIAFCNGDISNQEKGENIDGQFIIFTSAGAGVETTIPHSLGRIPSGYIIVLQNKGGAGLWHETTDTPWTTSNLYLKSDAATTTYTIFIF